MRAPAAAPQEWLIAALGGGPVESARIKVMAAEAGFGVKALRKARERLRVIVTRHGSRKAAKSMWSLAADPDRSARARGVIAPPQQRSSGTRDPKAHVAGATPSASQERPSGAVELLPAESTRVAARIVSFARYGMVESDARQLAVRLVVERDRTSSRTGSCIECIAFDGIACEPGRCGDAPGPRPVTEIWGCWCARRP